MTNRPTGYMDSKRFVAHCGVGACNIILNADGILVLIRCDCACASCAEMWEIERGMLDGAAR